MEKKNWNREEIRRVFRISHSLRVKVSDILKTVELLLHSQKKKEREQLACVFCPAASHLKTSIRFRAEMRL